MPLFRLNRWLSISLEDLLAKLLFFALGLLFLIPSAYKLSAHAVFRYHAVAVDGVIIDASRGRDIGARPFVEYTDLQGKSHERRSRAKTHWFFSPKIGEKIKIFYDQRDPDKATVDSLFHYILLPFCFLLAGVGFLAYVFRK